MSKKDVVDFVKEYTSTKFRVIKADWHESNEKRAVVKFEEVKDVLDFVEVVMASSSAKGCCREDCICIQRVDFFGTPSCLPDVICILCHLN